MTVKTEITIPFFNYQDVYGSSSETYKAILEDICKRGAFILQKELETFEQQLASYSGSKYALGVANGTDALILALHAAGVTKGDEVIFCSHTYIATAAAIHFVGATPVPVDCSSDHLIDPEKIEEAITSRTKAIMPTQLNGRCSPMDEIVQIAQNHNLVVIEDAAQGLGATYKGKSAGTFGFAGTISFYPAKTLGSFGDGGAILVQDDQAYQTLKQLRDHGRNDEGLVVSWGLNSRLDNLQAGILNEKLKYYRETVTKRRQIASWYTDRLADIDELVLPPAPSSDARYVDVFQNYEIEAQRRNELKAFLSEKGVGTIVQWGGHAVHQFKDLGFDQTIPFAERVMASSLLLPMYPTLKETEVDYISHQIRQFYGREE